MNPFSFRQLAAYGLFGFPLALVALPLYVYLPQFYVQNAGLSLALIGVILLGTRLLDAFIDPLLGAWVDSARIRGGYARQVLLALPFLLLGFVALFHGPLGISPSFSAAWLVGALLLVYFGFSLASIAYQAWGAELTSVAHERPRITAAREGAGLVGVVFGAALPQALGMGMLSSLFCVSLVLTAVLLLRYAPRPAQQISADSAATTSVISKNTTVPISRLSQLKNWRAIFNFSSFSLPFSSVRFRWLLAVFLLNGIAAAIPATLVTFFISDVIKASSTTGIFLALYFLSGAASMPLWVKCAARWGQARAWAYSMGLAVLAFAGVYWVGAGDVMFYGVICVLSGLVLGADLALPPALLAAVIQQAGHQAQREGAYFGVWNFATKLNLALAAGISLPLLAWLGYVPGSQGAQVQILSAAYAALPCIFKVAAVFLLSFSPFLKTRE